MGELMDAKLRDKLGFCCAMSECNLNNHECNNLLIELVVTKIGTSHVSVFGDMYDVDTLNFKYSDNCVLTEWERWQFELWVERNIESLVYNWQKSESIYTELL